MKPADKAVASMPPALPIEADIAIKLTPAYFTKLIILSLIWLKRPIFTY
jgi:hypothetical protein